MEKKKCQPKKRSSRSSTPSGADQASVTARSNLDLAQSQVERMRQVALEAEEGLRESRAEDSPRMEPAAQPLAAQEGEEEEEIPEAYLRED